MECVCSMMKAPSLTTVIKDMNKTLYMPVCSLPPPLSLSLSLSITIYSGLSSSVTTITDNGFFIYRLFQQ